MSKLRQLEAAFASDDPESRRRALALLQEPGFEPGSSSQFLLRALGDDDWRVRKQAIEVVTALPPFPELLAGLVLALEPGDNVGLRNAVVEALGAFGEPALNAIVDKLPALDADGKKLAAEALARTLLPAALPALRPLLLDRDPNVRAAAIEGIARVGAAAADDALEILESFLARSEEEPFVRLSALDGINRLGSQLPWRTIERMLSDPVLERSALSAAGRSMHPQAWGALLAALERAQGGGVSTVLAALLEYARSFAQSELLLRAEPPSERVVERLLRLSCADNEDLPSRKAALIVAGALGLERVAPLAAEALSDVRVLGEADEALGLLGARAVPALLERLTSADADTCAVCIGIVSSLADRALTPLPVASIRNWVDAGVPVVARAGLAAITLLGNETCFPTVERWLGSEEAGSAAETALAALAQRYPDAARARARGARAEGAEAHAAAVIHSALAAPIRDTVSEDVAYLSLLLSHPDKAVRRAALAGLGRAGSELGAQTAGFALTDEEPAVRYAAVLALSRLRSADGALVGMSKLLELVHSSADDELTAAALGALAESGDARVLGVLRSLLRNAPPLVAVAAIEALARSSDPRRVDALLEGFSHGELEVAKASILALSDSADPRVIPHLGACLDHAAWDVRRLSADMLGRMGGEAVLILLRARLSHEDNPRVLEAISRAIEEASGADHIPLPPRAESLGPR